MFPVFSGIMLVNTNAYVTISNAAPFLINYPSFTYPQLTYYGLPAFNFMPTELYNTSHVSITNSRFTGWFSSNLIPPDIARNVAVVHNASRHR